jgi:glutaconate CoA-transferase subunit A
MPTDSDQNKPGQAPNGKAPNKVLSLQGAVALIHDGDQVAIGGHSHRGHPMGLIYEMIRQRKKDLRLMGWNNGIDFDILVGAGCVSEVQTSYVGMLKHGLALNYRRAAEQGEIAIIEESEITALARFRAGAMGLPFIPSRSPLGSDLMQFDREYSEATDPFTGKKIALLRAAQPDVSIIHGHTADSKGNVQFDARYLQEKCGDIFVARSGKTVIVSVEEIVETAEIMSEPHRTVLPGFQVDAVVELPRGAHPCACDKRYDYDLEFIDAYYEASRSPEEFARFLDTHVRDAGDHQDYLRQVGLAGSDDPHSHDPHSDDQGRHA